ncbi:MAG: type II/IV secretion system ATPase subunit [Candidatus Aenigmatarchaeota archaeon]|nr:MAG: type II/IV secretion system ATPase subunit [Candidatus Aenigmarchaeota archaeon]
MAEKLRVCDYSYDEDKMRLRVNCLGCLYGASIEDFEECMANTIDKILEVKKVSSIILAKEREYIYDYEQTKMLVEIAKVIEWVVRERLMSYEALGSEKCKKFHSKWHPKLQYLILDILRKDPIGAYVEILREMRHVKTYMKKLTSRGDYDCFYNYRKNVLEVIKSKLEGTKLIQGAKDHVAGYKLGNRDMYRQVFMPSVRPNFMLTRYIITPPEHGKSVDRYSIGDVKIEIFKLPDTAEYFYYVLPPEFRLSEEKYSVLDAARRYMATHRPKTAEFVKSKRVREVFYSIGRDMIREVADKMGITLTTKELEQLATILTRYTAGLGVLEILLMDERVQDLYVNSPIERQPILIYHQNWEECKTNLIPTMEDAEAWATRLRIQSGRPLDEANPVLDTDLEVPGGKARFAVITRSLSPHGLGFAIRRHRDRPWTLPLFIKNKMVNPLAAGLLSFLIDGSVSMLVAGGRSAGKTSVLGSLMLEILPKVRIVSIEDTLELPIEQLMELHYNIERLKSRSVITRVETEMPADEALRTALRLGDSALIIGEVRSVEAKALYEAMRIGALSNVVAGTIHGESAYGVYDRVVNDLGVPPTSFKATDIIPICKSLRSADGLHRFRRMTEITEVRKEWEEDPVKEGGFVNLMEYSGKEDTLKPTDTFVNGESEVLNRIASYVREWSGNWEAVWENIQLRAKVKQTLVEMSEKLKMPELIEAEWIVKNNSMFHLIGENIRKEIGFPDPERIYLEWNNWIKKELKVLRK